MQPHPDLHQPCPAVPPWVPSSWSLLHWSQSAVPGLMTPLFLCPEPSAHGWVPGSIPPFFLVSTEISPAERILSNTISKIKQSPHYLSNPLLDFFNRSLTIDLGCGCVYHLLFRTVRVPQDRASTTASPRTLAKTQKWMDG